MTVHPVLVLLAVLSILIMGAVLWLFLDGIRHQLLARFKKNRFEQSRVPIGLEVVERQDITEDLFTLRLRHPAGKPLPVAKPGQSIMLLIPGESGQTLRRCYSLAAWARNSNCYELGIKRESLGKASSWLYENMVPGKSIQALLPRGTFSLALPPQGEIVLVGGGIGITPLRAMLHRIQAEKNLGNCSVTLYYAARTQERLMYNSEFQKLQEACSWLNYVPVLSVPDCNWGGLVGHLTADDILSNLKLPKAANFYLCAPGAIMQELMTGLKEKGVLDAQLHFESFGARAAGVRSADDAEESTYPVTLLPNHKFVFQGQPTLLTALDEEGLQVVNSDCRAGSCGQCKVRLVEGQVRWLIQPECKIETDEILLCCCVPEQELTLQH